MEKFLIEYIKINYWHLLEINEEHKKELEIRDNVSNFIHKKETVISKYQDKKEAEKDLIRLKVIYDITDKDILKYDRNYNLKMIEMYAKDIYEKHKHNMFFNRCPICGHLARTTTARQGPCGHSWRDYELIEDDKGDKVWVSQANRNMGKK